MLFSEIERLALPDKYYMPWPVTHLRLFSICETHAKLAAAIGRHFDDHRLASNISASVVHGSFACPLTITVKAHKDPGSQGVRTIHRGFNPSFANLSIWLCKVLEPYLALAPWSHKDSYSVHKILVAFCGSLSSIVVKVDLKDFFLSRESWSIASAVSKLVEDRSLADLVQRAIYFLLENQFVVTSTLACTYRCHKGSGIGLKVSAILSNLFFFAMVEQDFVPKIHGMSEWVRYHDDVVAVFRDRESARRGVAAIKKRAQPTFKVIVEGVYSAGTSLTFLDMDVEILDHDSVQEPRFEVCASQSKPLTPLCPTSAHFPAVHRAWPTAVAKRVSLLSDLSFESHQFLCQRYCLACTHNYTQKLLDDWSPGDKSQGELRAPDSAPRIPFVFRFHPCNSFAFSRALNLLPPPEGIGFRPIASWRNALPSLHGLVEKANRKSLSRDWNREGRCFSFPFANLGTNGLNEFGLQNLINSMHV